MNITQLQGLVRHIMSIAGGYGISIGAGSGAEWETVTGIVLALVSITWSTWEKRST